MLYVLQNIDTGRNEIYDCKYYEMEKAVNGYLQELRNCILQGTTEENRFDIFAVPEQVYGLYSTGLNLSRSYGWEEVMGNGNGIVRYTEADIARLLGKHTREEVIQTLRQIL